MDPLVRIDEVTALVERARAVPMSGSCMVNRSELLDLLDQLRGELPASVRQARRLLAERDEVLAAAQQEAERIAAGGLVEQRRLVAEEEVVRTARHESSRLRAQATADAERLRSDADDYVDAKLAAFEDVLVRILRTVQRGRGRLRRNEAGPLDRTEDEGLPAAGAEGGEDGRRPGREGPALAAGADPARPA